MDVLSSTESRESFVREARKRAPSDVVAAMADVLAHHAGIVAEKQAAGLSIQRAVSSMEDVVRRHHGNVAEPSDMGIPAEVGAPTRRFRTAVLASTRARGGGPAQQGGDKYPPARTNRTGSPPRA